MTDYKLEIKQIVDYPQMPHLPAIHTESDRRPEHPYKRVLRSFHYAVLCCYANFRTSYQRYNGISYIVHPGQWICPLQELRTWFRAYKPSAFAPP